MVLALVLSGLFSPPLRAHCREGLLLSPGSASVWCDLLFGDYHLSRFVSPLGALVLLSVSGTFVCPLTLTTLNVSVDHHAKPVARSTNRNAGWQCGPESSQKV